TRSSVSCSSSGWPSRGASGSSRSAAMFTAAGARSEEALFHGDDVPRAHRFVLAHALRGLRAVVVADDEDLFLRGALPETAGKRHRFPHREAGDEGVAAGLFHLAIDEEAAVFDDRHRNLRIDEVTPGQ